MDRLALAQQNIANRPLFANREMTNLSTALGCSGIDLYRALEQLASTRKSGIPIASEDAPELFNRQAIEVAPEQNTTYPTLNALTERIPQNLFQRSGSTHRRPAVKLYESRAKDVIFGFYKEVPILMKDFGGKLHPFPGVMSDKIRLLNAVGGLGLDLSDSRALQEPAILFVDYDWTNFCHWMSDWLIGLNWLCAGWGRKPKDFQYIFPKKPKAFNVQSLRLLGVDENNIHYPHTEQKQYLFRTDHVIATSLGSQSFRHCFYYAADWAVEFARRNLVRASDQTFPERFVISRPSRGLQLADGAARLLAERGFAFITLETLPLAEQFTLFSRAKSIVAPHGAGLTSLVFCERGANVLEVCNTSLGSHAFFTIAAHCHLNYFCAACDESSAAPPKERAPFLSEEVVSTWLDRVDV